MAKPKQPVWARSISIDKEGMAWTHGVRADFVYVLFMHGYPIPELSHCLIDGFTIPRQAIEDAIRWGMQRRKANG